ncbi:hypothetical protein NC653_013937 [Populus alba x Populus x berolinensis]|uniref:Uncharacterized protein n=1 Tax=Populus alba x Populus x berolinensis TaxID=444605 RepID=A0AAD6W458_9ROSI|nr:hypothetical protein NC653_013937 [Populus alba x Populus x berolinensis]
MLSKAQFINWPYIADRKRTNRTLFKGAIIPPRRFTAVVGYSDGLNSQAKRQQQE